LFKNARNLFHSSALENGLENESWKMAPKYCLLFLIIYNIENHVGNVHGLLEDFHVIKHDYFFENILPDKYLIYPQNVL